MKQFAFNMFDTMAASANSAEASSVCAQNENIAVLKGAVIEASIFIIRILRLDLLLSVLIGKENFVTPGRVRA